VGELFRTRWSERGSVKASETDGSTTAGINQTVCGTIAAAGLVSSTGLPAKYSLRQPQFPAPEESEGSCGDECPVSAVAEATADRWQHEPAAAVPVRSSPAQCIAQTTMPASQSDITTAAVTRKAGCNL